MPQMASNAAQSLLRLSAREHDLLFPEGGLNVPDFLLRDPGGELSPSWRDRYQQIVSNEWMVTERIFNERSYATIVDIRNQLREREVRIQMDLSTADDGVERLEEIIESLSQHIGENSGSTGIRELLGEASPRSNAGKMGWAYDKVEEIYAIRGDGDSKGVDPDTALLLLAKDCTLELAAERIKEKGVDLREKRRQIRRSHQLCRFKLQVMDAMLWQYELFGELVGLSADEITRAADHLEEVEMRSRRETCNVPALRAAWEWMLRNRKRCWDPSGWPNRRAIWQAMLLDPEHSKSLLHVSGPGKGTDRITSDTADRYMTRFEREIGQEGLMEFRRSLGIQSQ